MSDPQPNQPESHVNVLVAGTDLQFARAVQLACHNIAPQNKDINYRIFPAANKEKMLELINKYPLHSIIFEKDFSAEDGVDTAMIEAKVALAKKGDGMETALVLAVADIESTEQVSTAIRKGWKDVINKHLDTSLFVQKMNLYNSKIPFIKEDMLFVMPVEKEVGVAMTYKTKTLAEFGVRIETLQAMAPETCLTVHIPGIESSFCASVLSCKPTDKTFEVHLMFVGLTPSQTQEIRRFMRHEYAEEKQAG